MRAQNGILFVMGACFWSSQLAYGEASPCLGPQWSEARPDADRLKDLVRLRQDLERVANTEGLRPLETECLTTIKSKIDALLRKPSGLEARTYDYLLVWGQNLWLDRNFKDAEATFARAVASQPTRIAGLWYLASFVELAERAQEANTLYQRIVKLKPTDEFETKSRAQAAEKVFASDALAGDAKLKFAQEWLVENPESLSALRAMTQAAIETQHFDALLAAKKLEKDPANALWIQAHLSFLDNKFSESLVFAEKFKKANQNAEPYDRAYYKLIATIYLKLNQPAKAFQLLLKMPVALRLNKDLQKLFEEAVAQSTLGPSDLQLATAIYPESMSLQAQALDTLMRDSAFEKDEFDPVVFRSAAAYSDRLLAANFALVDAHYWRGYMAFQRDEFKEADQEFLQSLKLVQSGKAIAGKHLELGRVFATAALSKLAQHYTAEASELVGQGLKVVRDRKHKELLLDLKARVEKQML